MTKIEVLFLTNEEAIRDRENTHREKQGMDPRSHKEKYLENELWYLHRSTKEGYIYADPEDITLVQSAGGGFCKIFHTPTKQAYYVDMTADRFYHEYMK